MTGFLVRVLLTAIWTFAGQTATNSPALAGPAPDGLGKLTDRAIPRERLWPQAKSEIMGARLGVRGIPSCCLIQVGKAP
jgi:hypothetical protein